MKKTLALILVAVMVATLCATLAVSAAAEKFLVTAWNPENPGAEEGVIYVGTNINNGWWQQVSFKPNGSNWEVVEVASATGSALAIPEGGFVWALHDTSTNNWQFIANMTAGEVYTIKGLDLANQTVSDNATIALYDPNAVEEDPSVEEDAPATETVVKNIAVGKDYTIGNSGIGHIVSGGEWPCNYNADLTDGVASSEVTYDDKWFAFAIYESDNGYNVVDGKGSVTVDLGEATDIVSVSANIGVALDAGVATPAKAEVFVSDDGENFTSVGELAAVTATGWTDLAYEGTARYVKIEFTVAEGAGFVFIDEIAVNAEVEVPAESTPDAGDASNMIVFAVIALVALAGTAVVVKTRG